VCSLAAVNDGYGGTSASYSVPQRGSAVSRDPAYAGTQGNGRDAPIPDVSAPTMVGTRKRVPTYPIRLRVKAATREERLFYPWE
jgi:hypothetical protein